MKKHHKIILALLLIIKSAFAQDTTTYDTSKISSTQEINFEKSDKRGVKDKSGIIYYVEKDLKTLTAYEKSEIKWRTNIIFICGKPAEGEPAIRYLKLDQNKLIVKFAKHNFAIVEINNGSIINFGTD